ncbi:MULTISPECIES: hypothetical protein [Acaryochloris]|uniref:Uncharacterized protein n=1 Tax=Acaryochloris marina (strain MBIC 11017) TaxID=329726 RepID=B0C1X2_ACAM1|nr:MULTISPECIES: hypothetical protein [Acaryochloris]ABW26138.1 hypothetical protein AM1_1099 [Acaryochloris marina MBIC11017]BDM80977.1 hypothetical protein AM10699_38440 [Acaryochloris marina MBIC10699]
MVAALNLMEEKVTSKNTFSKKHKQAFKSDICALTADSDIGWMKLGDAYQQFVKDQQADIPLSIWLIENPNSPIALPGSVDLKGHDYIHLLLNRGMSLFDEAFVIGYTMGNCVKVGSHHIYAYKLFSKLFFPQPYQFNALHRRAFDFGFMYGRKVRFKNIHKVHFEDYSDQSIHDLRIHFGINLQEINCLWNAEQILLEPPPACVAI